MDDDRTRNLFEALEMAGPKARAAYLKRGCGEDVTLRRKVDELLKEHFSNDSLLAGFALDGERAAAVESPVGEAAARVIGRYKLMEKIGEGGLGEVWMAEQREPVKRLAGREQLPAGWHYERLAATMMSHGATNRLPEAEEALRKALEIERNLAGEKYPALAWPHLRMARLLEQQTGLLEAEEHYRAAAEVARGTQGLSKDQRAYFIRELGRFLGRVGKQQESATLISESQSISPTPGL